MTFSSQYQCVSNRISIVSFTHHQDIRNPPATIGQINMQKNGIGSFVYTCTLCSSPLNVITKVTIIMPISEYAWWHIKLDRIWCTAQFPFRYKRYWSRNRHRMSIMFSNNQQHDFLFGLTAKRTIKLRITDALWGECIGVRNRHLDYLHTAIPTSVIYRTSVGYLILKCMSDRCVYRIAKKQW